MDILAGKIGKRKDWNKQQVQSDNDLNNRYLSFENLNGGHISFWPKRKITSPQKRRLKYTVFSKVNVV